MLPAFSLRILETGNPSIASEVWVRYKLQPDSTTENLGGSASHCASSKAGYLGFAHISLPICRIAPTLNGCEPYSGILTGQQIWSLAQEVGKTGGLVIHLVLAAVMAWLVTRYIEQQKLFLSMLLGFMTSLTSLSLALVLKIPLNWHTLRGVLDFLSLLLIPLSAYLGGRLAKRGLTRKIRKPRVRFQPSVGEVLLEPGGESLSEREMEVLTLVASGYKNQEIAGLLHISPATVKTHLNHIYAKMGVRNRTTAVTKALSCGLLSPENLTSENENPSSGG